MGATKVANEYLKAFYSGDLAGARATVIEDFSFSGPFVQTSSRDAFFQSAAPLARIVRGHRLLKQWDDGDDVCSFYELNLETPAGKGAVLMSEWHTVRRSKLVSARVVFDTAARSEEHTSELQSQSNLVCRLLLEKKKKRNKMSHPGRLRDQRSDSRPVILHAATPFHNRQRAHRDSQSCHGVTPPPTLRSAIHLRI